MLVLFHVLNFLTLRSDPNPEVQQWKDMQFLLELVPNHYQDLVFFFCAIPEPWCRWPKRKFQEIIPCKLGVWCSTRVKQTWHFCLKTDSLTAAHTLDLNLSSCCFLLHCKNSHSSGTIHHTPHLWTALPRYFKCSQIMRTPPHKVLFVNILPLLYTVYKNQPHQDNHFR